MKPSSHGAFARQISEGRIGLLLSDSVQVGEPRDVKRSMSGVAVIQDKLDRLTDEFIKIRDREKQAKVLALVAIDAATLVADELPAAAEAALAQARLFWSGGLSRDELTEARVAAWESIEGRSCDFAQRQVNLVRLVICSLYPTVERGEEDLALEATIDFSRSVGISDEALERSLERHMANVSGGENVQRGGWNAP